METYNQQEKAAVKENELRETQSRAQMQMKMTEDEKIARIGVAQALATEEQVRAYGRPQFQVTQQVLNRFSYAIQFKVDVVSRIMVSGGGESGNVWQYYGIIPCSCLGWNNPVFLLGME